MQLDVSFSNGDHGLFHGAAYLAERQGPLLEPLRDPAYFQKCFVDMGALCWPNGLELSAQRVHEVCCSAATA
jgi:hypothetical protein